MTNEVTYLILISLILIVGFTLSSKIKTIKKKYNDIKSLYNSSKNEKIDFFRKINKSIAEFDNMYYMHNLLLLFLMCHFHQHNYIIQIF